MFNIWHIQHIFDMLDMHNILIMLNILDMKKKYAGYDIQYTAYCLYRMQVILDILYTVGYRGSHHFTVKGL